MTQGVEVLREVQLDQDRHKPTGNTRHYVGGELWEGASALRIFRYRDEEGFYLLSVNDDGDEVTDTWHQSLEDAVHQAEFEFDLKARDWTVLAE